MVIARHMLTVCDSSRCHAAGRWSYFNKPPSRSRFKRLGFSPPTTLAAQTVKPSSAP